MYKIDRKAGADGRTGRTFRQGLGALAALFLSFGLAAGELPQQRFPSSDAAATALLDALKSGDVPALKRIFGTASGQLVVSGDAVQDREMRERFAAAYLQKHQWVALAPNRSELRVGNEQWPFPIPLVRQGRQWAFDTRAGEREILDRRIGANELSVIQVCKAVREAQQEYRAMDTEASGVPAYAQRFRASPGKKDGLYWPVAPGEKSSPAGPLLAAAQAEGYASLGDEGGAKPYHGYFYRLLTAQGPDAPGGELNYFEGRHLTRGYAVFAWPATYGVSGIASFQCGADGSVYSRNFGKNTAKAAADIYRFNPDRSWFREP